MYKYLSIFLFASLLFNSGFSQDLPQPSQFGTITQQVGLTEITVEYSRPSVKDRVIFGDLVPYGEMWRTGANASTKIEFSKNVKIKGKEIPAGKYALYTIPGAKEWTIVIHKNTDHWGVGGDDYKQEEDLTRFNVKAESNPFTETFTVNIGHVKNDKCHIELIWEKTKVKFEVDANAKDEAMANIKKKLDEIENGFRAYNRSARYLVDNDLDPEQALKWAEKSVALEQRFWNVYTLSLAQAKNKKYKEAISMAEKSKDLAIEADYKPYIKMNDENIAKWKKLL